MAEAVWDAIFAKSKLHPRWDAGWSKCIPLEAQLYRRKTTKKTNNASQPYVPLPVFWAWELIPGPVNSAVGCRKTLNLVETPLDCRIRWKDVERRRKLLNIWQRAKNTQSPSNSGSLRPASAWRKGAGKGRRRRPARFALSGPKSELPLPMGKAWQASGSGSKRKVASSSPCKASVPTSHAFVGRREPRQANQIRRSPNPWWKPSCHLLRTGRRMFMKAPRKSTDLNILPARQTKAS
jgi:hypothetical protein